MGLCCDQGPMALWTSRTATGPFTHRAYVLGVPSHGWDAGGYSESKVAFSNGLCERLCSAFVRTCRLPSARE